MEKSSNIYIAGHNGMVGSALLKKYQTDSNYEILTQSSQELDLRNQSQVNSFFEKNKPDQVIIAAAKVGGILANNNYRAEFLYDNLMIQSNIINSAYENNCEKLLFLGSSCIYPKLCSQPIKEEYLLTGELEYTNEPYAIAKIAGIKLCENYFKQYGCNFLSVMPTNLYGPNDNFDLQNSHVLPALIRKIHEAKINRSESVTIWGSGSPKREFLYVEDLADACKFIMENVNAEDLYESGITHVNVGTGKDCSILELAEEIKRIVEFEGQFNFDTSKPDGTPRKLLDVLRMKRLGWTPKTNLIEGLTKTIIWYLNNKNNANFRE